MNYEENELLTLLASKIYCGLGYIVIPSDVERLDYIQTCFASETISFYPEVGGTSYNNVPVSVEALQSIEFPEIGKQFGSQVIYLLHPTHRFPIVIGVVDKLNESITLGWKEFKLSKVLGQNEVTVLGDAKQGNLFITVQTQNDTGGEFQVNIKKGDGTGKFSLNVQGDIAFICKAFGVINSRTSIDSSVEIMLNSPEQLINCNTFVLTSKDNVQIQTIDYELKNETTRILSSEKISLGSEVDNYQPAVLGQILVDDILTPLIDTLKELKVATALGPSGVPVPDTISKLDDIKNKLEDILSEKVELE